MIEFGLGIYFRDISNEFFNLVKDAEKGRFDYIWIPDELMEVDVYPTLTKCATITKRIRLGIAVTNPYSRHPIVTALAVATLEKISNGRMILGIGAGSTELPEKLGLERINPSLACTETVDIIRRLWREEELTYQGKIFKTRRAKMHFKINHQIPIFVAARGELMLKTAGRIGDGVIIGGMVEPHCLDFALKHVERGVINSNRSMEDIHKVVWGACSLSKNFEDVRKAVRDMVAYVVYTLPETLLHEIGVNYNALMKVRKTYHSRGRLEAGKNVTDEMIKTFSFAGTPSECIEKIKILEKQNISQAGLLLYPNDGNSREQVLKLLVKEVIPQFD